MATSLTKGDAMRNVSVTPNGMPPLTKPMNSGTEEHEPNRRVWEETADALNKIKAYDAEDVLRKAIANFDVNSDIGINLDSKSFTLDIGTHLYNFLMNNKNIFINL